MMDRLDALALFRRIVDTGSITATAEHIGASKAMVSKALSGLEERLGARLLERTTRSMAPTELGQLVYRQAEGLIEGYDALESLVREQQGQAQGLLRLSAPLSFPMQPLAQLMQDMARQEPGVRIELVRSDSFVNLIDEGFDVALRMASLPDSQMIARRVAPLRTGLFAAPDYLAQRGTPQHPSELDDHACILDSNLRPKRHYHMQIDGQVQAIPVSGAITVNGVNAALELAVAGAGIMIAPEIMVRCAVDAGALVPVLADFAPPEYGLFLVYPGRQFLPLKVRRFVDLASDRLAAYVGG